MLTCAPHQYGETKENVIDLWISYFNFRLCPAPIYLGSLR